MLEKSQKAMSSIEAYVTLTDLLAFDDLLNFQMTNMGTK